MPVGCGGRVNAGFGVPPRRVVIREGRGEGEVDRGGVSAVSGRTGGVGRRHREGVREGVVVVQLECPFSDPRVPTQARAMQCAVGSSDPLIL